MISKLPLIILSILLIHATTSSANLYVGSLPEFSYSGQKGPGRWGGLCPQYSTCRLGKRQSPVNIQRGKAVNSKELGPLTRYYNAVNSTLVNNGFNIGVHYEEEAGFIMIDGKKFTLTQMHWHCPSEHRIDGIQFPAELHLVHRSVDGNLSVVAILFKYNRPDPLISQIKEKVDELAKEVSEGKKEAHVPLGTLDLKPFRKQTRKYYRYVGSLTTPPCNETVIWNILGKVRSISEEQVRAIKAPLLSSCKTNARPCQPLNGRNIMVYDERVEFNTDDDDY